MKKKLFFIAALAAGMMLASCASSDDGLQVEKPSPTDVTTADGKYPVSFTAYAERGVTRGGKEGLMDIDALKAKKAEGGGFGVFGYYTDLKKYDQTYVPNLMYNQGVFWKGADGTGAEEWLYSPVVYWPNESGTDAQSDDEDKVTFFAYAPYVESTSGASGSVADATSGITGFSRNSNAGDPLVKYIANFSTRNTVDLCWGVCNEPSWAKIQGGTAQSMTAGLPWIDVEHPQTTGQKMGFTFKHALAQLNVHIDADGDVAGHDATGDNLDSNTKIYVRSISFTGVALKGALNLNNTTPNQALWLDYGGTTDLPYGQSVTVKDGRRDGREGTTGAEATNETPAGLNPAIIQNDASHPTTGVTTKSQNLFEPAVAAAIPGQPTDDEITAALPNPVYVIPTGEAMTVTIVYDVETKSANLPGYLSDGVTHGSSVENKITKNITFNGQPMGLESGKKYTIGLHLGMNSVKVDTEVGEWDAGGNSNSWLPDNLSAVRIMKDSKQITHATLSTSDADLELTAMVRPEGVAQTLKWTSSNPAVASIADTNVGTIHPEADGECTITATSKATGKSASVKLLVTHKYSDVVAGDVRKIIAANGYIYTNTTQAKEYGTNGVGIICYVVTNPGDKVDMDPSASGYKALALALTDANDGATCQWCDVNTNSCLPKQLTDYADPYGTESSYQSGIANTSTLIGDGHTHVAAQKAKTYSVVVSGFTNSGWFLPSISQWNMMIKTLAPTSESDAVQPGKTEDASRLHNTGDIPMYTWTNAGYTGAVLNPVLTATGATGLQSYAYWSSTEHGAFSAWYVYSASGYVHYGYAKARFRSVRAALAF